MVSQASIRVIASSESWIEQAAIDQLHQTATLPGIDAVVGLPDLHAGRGIAVGAAFRSHGLVYPHLVGSDIGCGMGLWRTGLSLRKFRPDAVVRKLRGLEEPWAGDAATRLAERGLPRFPARRSARSAAAITSRSCCASRTCSTPACSPSWAFAATPCT